jgi:aldehyde dehydrogenase (NAD(P)+)
MGYQKMESDQLDKAVSDLQEHKDEWACKPIEKKIDMLLQLRRNLGDTAQSWVDVSVEAKDIDPESPWAGEEWVHGPWAMAATIDSLIESLSYLLQGEDPKVGPIRSRNNGQVVVQVWPHNIYDWIFINDVKTEVWMQPGVTEQNLGDHMAAFYKNSNKKGSVALVLGAGNVSSIAPLDALHKLYNDGQVVVVKMNPILDYIGPLFAEVFSVFIKAGYLRVVYGGADVGQYLVHHPGVETVHLTGSTQTFEAIVYGSGEEGRERKEQKKPILNKPISSELGGVSPVIIVPGPWTESDIRYQAENIVTMKLHTAGTLCIAGQVLVMPEAWDDSGKLTGQIRELMRTTPARTAYYPGAAERQAAVLASHPNAELLGGEVPRTLVSGLDPNNDDEYCFRNEFFGAVYAQTSLSGDTASEFLYNAVAFCNERLQGALGATIIIHPQTMKRIGPNLEQAIGDLKYGGIGVNIWSAAAYMMSRGAWGGFQEDGTTDFHQSGNGYVHNALMFDKPQKTVIYGSFYAFPRSLRHGDLHFAPRPLWFLGNRTADTTARRVTDYYLDPSPKHLPGILLSALRG